MGGKKNRSKARVKVVSVIPAPEEAKHTVVLEVEDAPPLPPELPPELPEPVAVEENPDHPIVRWFKNLW
jgi:hypothetical protein